MGKNKATDTFGQSQMIGWGPVVFQVFVKITSGDKFYQKLLFFSD